MIHHMLTRDANDESAEMMVNTRTAADALHNSTKHGTGPAQPDRLVRYRRLDPDNAPDSFKRYRDLPI